jgi:CRP-like cAMP-binding protein
MIIRQDFSASHLYLLESGLVTLNVFDDHRVSTVKLLTPQSFIGIMCSFAGRRLDFSATALQNSTIRLVEMDTFERITKNNGEFAFMFIRYISSLTNEMVHWIMRVKGRNVDGAIALILLEFSGIYQSEEFELPVTRKELASIIGYSKESVINTLSQFNKDNIIHIREKSVAIIDAKRLRLISQAG